jgi:Arc/MetJ family transcription regulator
VRDGRPYPDHGFSTRDWAMIPPRQVRLDTLVTTRRELALDALLAEDSTFYGDLFPHAVQWHGETYLEDGLHRALRAALQQRNVIHVRVLDLDALMSTPSAEPTAAATRTSTRHSGELPGTAAPRGSGSWGAARSDTVALDLDGPR